jgi:mannose-P-dolichol utilization defect protein 1
MTAVAQEIAARAVSYVIFAASCGLYAPVIANALRSVQQAKTPALEPLTWVALLLSNTTVAAYNFARGYPIAAFGESITLATQALILLTLLVRARWRFVLLASVIGVVNLLLRAPLSVLTALQLVAMAMGSLANVPTIWKIVREKNAGDNSVITAILSLAGCSLRVFTTATMTKDLLLLCGFGVGAVVNSVLISCILRFPSQGENEGTRT